VKLHTFTREIGSEIVVCSDNVSPWKYGVLEKRCAEQVRILRIVLNINGDSNVESFSALMLLAGQQEGHPACMVLAWLFVWSGVQIICIWSS